MKFKSKYQTIWNIISNYKWKSTFFSYLKSTFLLMFIPTIILTSVLVYFYNSSNTKTMLMANQQSSLKTKAYIEQSFSEIDKIKNSILSNAYATVFCLDKNNNNTSAGLKYKSAIIKTINEHITASESIEDIYLYSFNSNYVLSNSQSAELNFFHDKSWFEIYSQKKVTTFCYPSSLGTKSKTKNYLSFVYPFNYGRHTEGLLVITLRVSPFNDYIKSGNTDETVILIDNEKNILYSNNNSLVGTKYTKKFDEPEDIISVIEKNIITSSVKLENSDLVFISYTPVLKQKNTTILLIGYFIVLILILLILSFIFAIKFYINLSDLIITANLSGNFDNDKNYNEFKHLKDNILSNTEHINTIEDELIKKTNELKKSQQIALQMQIAPHFLLNTLNVINLFLLRSKDSATKVIHINSLLSEILVNLLQTSKYFVSIEEEVSYTKKYIEIESQKTKNCFSVKWYVDYNCYGFKTVKFILQPIIENAIFHGIKNLEEKNGLIEISIKEMKNDVVIIVSDNGIGMSTNTMKTINENLSDSSMSEDKHIGLTNVNKRLKLAYGSSYGCKIIKSDSTGTTVQLTFPVEY